MDSYTAETLQPGHYVYQLGNKYSAQERIGNFFDYNGESVLTAPDGKGAMGDLQVKINKDHGPYEGYTTFKVTKPVPSAVGEVKANTDFGLGGGKQAVIDISKFGDCLEPVCYTKFPGGADTSIK